jgi:hypothetical protein
MPSTTEILDSWPEAAREAGRLVVDQYGEPAEATDSELIWYGVGGWKRLVAQRSYWDHEFPSPHTDSVESFVDYRVPVERYCDIARFDGSVMLERTTGEASARCHDDQANRLALNLMHDIVIGAKDVEAARDYYAKEFLDAKRKRPTPYMERLNFSTATQGSAADADQKVLSDETVEAAKNEAREGGRLSPHPVTTG